MFGIKKIVGLVLIVSGLFGFSLFKSGVSHDNLLSVSIQQNFCRFHEHKKECKLLYKNEFAKNNFTLHGLWPQPRSKQNCSNKFERLDSDLWRELKVKMPGVVSGLARHEWRKHGSCYGKSESKYFKDSLKLLDEVNKSKLKDFIFSHVGKVVTKQQINRVLKYPRKVQLVCKRGYITEIRFSLKGDVSRNSLEELQKDAKPLLGGCQRGKI